MEVKVKFKKLVEHAVLPKYAKDGDAGLDLTAIDSYYDTDQKYWEYGTGLAVEIPEGYVGLIFPRSSVSKKNLILANCVGVVDSGYRGEVTFRFKEIDSSKYLEDRIYDVGDRIGQMIIIPFPKIEIEEVEELSSTERGEGGYGSSGT
jgi:dUTP pyrophosphatase